MTDLVNDWHLISPELAATPQRLRCAFHSGAALPGLRAGRFCSDGWRGAHTARATLGGDMAVVWEAV